MSTTSTANHAEKDIQAQIPATRTRGVRFQVIGKAGPTRLASAIVHGGLVGGVPAIESVPLPLLEDICASIAKSRTIRCGTCLGYISAHASSRHELYLPVTPLIGRDASAAIPLAQVLSTSLTMRDSRHLALAAAKGMLQLRDTPWLRRQWGRKEIMLFKKDQKLLTTHPFVSTSIQDQHNLLGSQSGDYFPENPAIRNATVFSLGVLLIELALRKPFDDLMIPADLNPDGSKHPASDFFAATRLLDRVYEEQSEGYGDAASRCIRCDFGQRKADLDDAAFAGAVYEGVVAVLEEENRQFFGGPI